MSEGDRIRVLHIITRMIVGGAQENTLLSVEGLNELPGYEVSLASGIDQGPEGELLTRAGRCCPLIMVPELCREMNPLADVRALGRLYRLIRAGRYHIVHTHSSKAGVLGRIAARAAGTPLVLHTLHSLVFHDYQPWLVNRMWWSIKQLCAPMTDHFISVSDVIRMKAIAAGIGRPEKFTTIYSGMELDWFLRAEADSPAVRREFGIPPHVPVIGKVARFSHLKGHDQLLDSVPEVVRRHPDVRFFLIGDGMLRERLTRRARDMGVLPNLVFAGLIARERIPHLMGAMDVVVHTSLREGLARILPQAMAMAKPCVSFDIDGAPEVVIPGRTGFLVQPGDASGLAQAICQLIENRELRKRMGDEGRKLVDPAFRVETMVSRLDETYKRLLVRHSARLRRFRPAVEVRDAA